MFQARQRANGVASAVNVLELIYFATVRNLRKSHGNAVIGLLQNILQSLLYVAVFYAMFEFLNLRSTALRGDFLLYTMSGIFMYMTHTKALGAVVGAEGPTSAMMQHAPMNTVVSITSAALAALYIQFLSAAVILALYYCCFTSFQIMDPVGAIAMMLLAWISGCAIGLILTALKPWFPTPVGIISTVYQRANMIASGKMFLANSLPHSRLVLFSWNPLFHTIDQGRGFVFINYHPHNSSIMYPVYVAVALLMIGLMGEFFTRQHMSQSWGAKN